MLESEHPFREYDADFPPLLQTGLHGRKTRLFQKQGCDVFLLSGRSSENPRQNVSDIKDRLKVWVTA